MKLLYFGDSYTENFMNLESDIHVVDKNSGITLGDTFDFLFLSALDGDIYTHVVVCIESSLSKEERVEIEDVYRRVRALYKNVQIVGPYGDVDTFGLEKNNGSYTEQTKNIIGSELYKKYNNFKFW